MKNPYVSQSFLEERFSKGYGFCGPVRLKRHERNEKLNKQLERSPLPKRVTACASVPTHATPGRPKANGEQGWVFGSDPKATKAKATNCQRVFWVLKGPKGFKHWTRGDTNNKLLKQQQRPQVSGF